MTSDLRSATSDFVTVIIATCGRADRLCKVLGLVARAARRAGGRRQVVVADNDPALTAGEAVRAFRDDVLDVRVVQSRPRNKSAALNAAIAVCRTEWMAFTDDDTEPDEEWLRAGESYAAAGGVRVFGGRVLPGPVQEKLPATICWAGPEGSNPGGGIFVVYQPMPGSGTLSREAQAPIGANVFVSRTVFREHGEYDEQLFDICGRWALGIDDGEFGVRLVSRGEPIGYCHEALVVHPLHDDKFALGRRINHAFSHGWQQPIVFFEPGRPRIEPYRVRLLAGALWSAGRALLRGDRAAWASGLLVAARHTGSVACRWSTSYRAAVQYRTRQPPIWTRRGVPSCGQTDPTGLTVEEGRFQ